ncbi:MAG: glycoside hydrolase family 9 protein [Melioribacteraceae bacterium]
MKSTLSFIILILLVNSIFSQNEPELKINDSGYYELPGLNIMSFDDFYPEGHQGGITIIMFGKRLAANGDVRLEPTPGQWSPVPKMGRRIIDRKNNSIEVELWYPDSSKDRKGFNPIIYPDLKLKYKIKTEAIGNSIKIIVDIDNPLPEEWSEKVGFNLELFPAEYFGEFYLMDGKTGQFPRQPVSELEYDKENKLQAKPLAEGKELIVAPDKKEKRIKISSTRNQLILLDGRSLHNNGWFIIRSNIPSNVTKHAVEWIISPAIDTSWRYKPVIQISQVGFHPDQNKFAVIELDKRTQIFEPISLIKINEDSEIIIKQETNPRLWGNFLRYKYLRFDFSEIKDEGLYKIKYGNTESNLFEIKKDIFAKGVWQPTLDYFLPVQMCHMRVEDRYKVWHGLCHMDDAIMAPTNYNHFDGYYQHESTLTKYKSGEHIPKLNIGGWHDAGDYDLRIESQAETVYKLSLAYELFHIDHDQTTIDQSERLVIIHKPDGKPDILQQIEHGVLSIINAYESMGRLYRGIICQSLKQYVHLGDASTMTDNFLYKENEFNPITNKKLLNDDRFVFTEINPPRELYTSQALAAAYRVLKNYNSELSEKCLKTAEELFNKNSKENDRIKINAAAELYLSTSKNNYRKLLIDNLNEISSNIENYSETIGRLTQRIGEQNFTNKIESSIKKEYERITELQKENPYGIPYKPYIWGAGWDIQEFGVKILMLHLSFPNIIKKDFAFNALNFVLGCHPGENTASFVSGVGVNSLTIAYGFNRDEWSYIPGGIASGTALIRPDLPELKIFPYLWQQTEYVLGGGTTNYILLAAAADYIFNKKIF